MLALSTVCTEYADLFSGYGLYEKEYYIASSQRNQMYKVLFNHLDKVPYALQPKLKQCLQTLIENDIIADVDEPIDWVHNCRN